MPQAAAYVKSAPARVHKVYFPDPKRSFTRADSPVGMPPFNDVATDAGQLSLVACITGQPKKKKRDCEFTSGKVLTVHDGEFEVKLLEARTGKLVETRTFKGTSSGCPTFHKFWGQHDDVLTKVDAGLGKYLAGLEARPR